MKFGDFLISKSSVSKPHVDEALALQKYRKEPIGRLLVALGHLTKDVLNQMLTDFFKLDEEINLTDLANRVLALKSNVMFMKLAHLYKAIPLGLSESTICFAATSFEDELVQHIERSLGKSCEITIVPLAAFEYLSDLGPSDSAKGSNKLIVSKKLSDDERLNLAGPFSKILKECLGEAKNRGASDIHFEPEENSFSIYLRIHGDRYEWKHLDGEHKEGFINALKAILNLDLAVVGVPQDSRVSFNQFKLDGRVSSLLGIYGEKIVMRLLPQDKDFNIRRSGISQDTLTCLLDASNKRDGLILISGPTGSGKTSTLYALLDSLDCRRKNICTLENPVEYRLKGINQVDTSDSTLSFSAGLRALMRQDPDVILVGEVRDEETAKLCFKAASTGHLVFSTVHANGALEVIERLIGLGVDHLSIKSNLRLSVAQRLMRQLCQHCAVEAPSHLKDKIENSGTLRIRNESGCNQCLHGIKGRIPVLEYIQGHKVQGYLDGTLTRDQVVNASLREKIIDLAKAGRVDLNEALEHF